ncbi:DUF1801 domain-containing protein [Ancrocorticia populi]|uniref:DUF1801 domain-containing protein n=1 Tax=Ancrocorticia populi TaxID=2175228 RepID=A0A2V1K3J5_9ACTO|nr:DUF1801 domain-containing protein [Ancrocorticia populi]PWF25641.1 DUF1801 domain-containing protein [Ancrocorticia populi]
MPAKSPAMVPSDLPVETVLDRAIGPRRAEANELVALLEDISGFTPVVWAGRIIGFGEYKYKYASGHSGRAPVLAYAPGPAKHTLYLSENFTQRWPELCEQLGSYKASKVCLYITRLAKTDRNALRQLLELTLADTLDTWG